MAVINLFYLFHSHLIKLHRFSTFSLTILNHSSNLSRSLVRQDGRKQNWRSGKWKWAYWCIDDDNWSVIKKMEIWVSRSPKKKSSLNFFSSINIVNDYEEEIIISIFLRIIFLLRKKNWEISTFIWRMKHIYVFNNCFQKCP